MTTKLNQILNISLLTAIIASAGCETYRPERAIIRGLQEPNSVAANNAAVLAQYKDEWQYNRNGFTNEPPWLGLALSGGGMRSGSFSIGILHGLADIGVLTNIDLISSVSGGGYAASWFYIQSLNNNFDLQSIFLDANKYQRYLTNHGELFSHAATSQSLLRWTEYALREGVTTIVSQPVNLIANGVFGWHANVVPMRRFYQGGIDRVFHVVPNDEGRRSALDFTGFMDFSTLWNPPKNIRFETLSAIKGRLPFPIVNTTAHIQDAPAYEAGLLHNRIFEFTPLHYGSDYYGYHYSKFPVDYNRAISISGAALDTLSLSDPTVSSALSAINVDFGYFIDNPNVTCSLGNSISKLAPFPVYALLGRYQRNFNGDRIYLADGGESENLAAFSLVRRMCQNIIVVDGESDPNYQFEGYHRLKDALRREMGVDFSVTNIDEGHFTMTNQNDPVMQGTISYFPPINFDGKTIDSPVINVVYIKLSLNANRLADYPLTVSNYYNKTRGSRTSVFIPSEFPQESTEDLSYTPEQSLAYHELGRYIVTSNRDFFKRAASARE